MEEAVKNRIILILSVLTAIFFIGTIGSCRDAFLQKSAKDKEMAKRLDSEERMSKFSQDKTVLEAKAKKAEDELEAEKAAHQVTKKSLVQEQLVNQSLKDELQKITKLKEALEEDLKEALAAGKSQKPKK